MECSLAALTKQAVRSPDFKERMMAPVTSSSVRLLASSLRRPLSTRMVTSRRKPADLACCGFLVGSMNSTFNLGGVDELHLQLGGEGGVAVEQIARLGEAGGFVEVGELDFALEAADYLDGLVGEAELLVAGGIVALVVAVGEEVDGAQNREDHQDVSAGVSRVPGLSGFEETGSHITTSTGGIPSPSK